MAPKDPIEFTDREKLLLSYYRVPADSVSRRTWLYDGAIAVASIVCLLFALIRDDKALGFVAYALVVGRWFYIVVEGGRWNREFRSIFTKYDAKLRASQESDEKKSADEVA